MIEISNLSFSYTKSKYISNLSFSVKEGEIFGFLGPSGAGKSTLQKIMIGLLPNYTGSVIVDGVEVKNKKSDFYEKIGVDFEYPSLFEKLTAKENLVYFSKLYSHDKYSIDELLEEVGLLYDKDKKVMDYSKGMKSRLSFIKALVHKPKILFLDEPTSGLDPTNAKIMKDLILKEKRQGTTILLTTHNMEDAKELCDRVAFIVDGEIKALGNPRELIMKKGLKRIKFTYLKDGLEVAKEIDVKDILTDLDLAKVINDGTMASFHSTEPTLGDIFMEVTGRKLL